MPTEGPAKTAPDAPGKQPQNNVAVQPGQVVAPAALAPNQVRTLNRGQSDPSVLKNAIFFDGDEQMFVVYAGTDRKMKFSSFDEAEKYAAVPNPGHGFREKVLAPPTPQSNPAPAAPNPTAAPTTGSPKQAPAAGRNPSKRKLSVDADKEDGVGRDPRHHYTAHGLAILG